MYQIGESMQARSGRLAIGSIVAMAICSVLLSIVTLAGFRSPSAGDVAVTATPGSWVGLGILMTAALALVTQDLVHAARWRQRHVRLAFAVRRRAGDPIWTTEDCRDAV
jgi:hypothetical protein